MAFLFFVGLWSSSLNVRSHPHCLLVVIWCATNSHRYDLRQVFIYTYITYVSYCVPPVSSSWFLPPLRFTNKTCFTLRPSCSHRKIHAAFVFNTLNLHQLIHVQLSHEPSFQFAELQPTTVNVWVCQPGESDFAEQSILKGFRGFERITYEMLVMFTSNILTRQMKMTFIIPRHCYRRLNHTSYSHTSYLQGHVYCLTHHTSYIMPLCCS